MATRKNTIEYRAWLAMNKFTAEEPLTNTELRALSWLTLIDKTRLVFEAGNVRWAESEAERADNRRFYQSLGPTVQ